MSFVLPAGHPHAAEAQQLLEVVREQVNALWRRAAEYNEKHPPPEGCDRLTFYFGQHLVCGGDAPAPNATAGDPLPTEIPC